MELKMKKYRFTAVRATQANGKYVLAFAAKPKDILNFASIDGVKRHEDGTLDGFQRHQIAPHIKEIRKYLERPDAILPNAVIIAFLDGIKVKEKKGGLLDVEITVTNNESPGFVVDGQQRLTALSGVERDNFEIFVSAIVCKDYNELRQQFILINNTRPLPKSLIYELLPNVEGLPDRFGKRSFAAKMVEKLNYTKTENPVFYGRIHQHTNSKGKLSDLAIQKIVMGSASNGAIRKFIEEHSSLDSESIQLIEEKSFELINTFYSAVRDVFPDAWNGMTPRTSRLVHGAGLVAMSFVMEQLYSLYGEVSKEKFIDGLKLIAPKTSWTEGIWVFSKEDKRPWNGIQNTPTDIDLLTTYLMRKLRKAMKKRERIE